MTKLELFQLRVLCEFLDAIPVLLDHLAALARAY